MIINVDICCFELNIINYYIRKSEVREAYSITNGHPSTGTNVFNRLGPASSGQRSSSKKLRRKRRREGTVSINNYSEKGHADHCALLVDVIYFERKYIY